MRIVWLPRALHSEREMSVFSSKTRLFSVMAFFPSVSKWFRAGTYDTFRILCDAIWPRMQAKRALFVCPARFGPVCLTEDFGAESGMNANIPLCSLPFICVTHCRRCKPIEGTEFLSASFLCCSMVFMFVSIICLRFVYRSLIRRNNFWFVVGLMFGIFCAEWNEDK